MAERMSFFGGLCATHEIITGVLLLYALRHAENRTNRSSNPITGA